MFKFLHFWRWQTSGEVLATDVINPPVILNTSQKPWLRREFMYMWIYNSNDDNNDNINNNNNDTVAIIILIIIDDNNNDNNNDNI